MHQDRTRKFCQPSAPSLVPEGTEGDKGAECWQNFLFSWCILHFIHEYNRQATEILYNTIISLNNDTNSFSCHFFITTNLFSQQQKYAAVERYIADSGYEKKSWIALASGDILVPLPALMSHTISETAPQQPKSPVLAGQQLVPQNVTLNISNCTGFSLSFAWSGTLVLLPLMGLWQFWSKCIDAIFSILVWKVNFFNLDGT